MNKVKTTLSAEFQNAAKQDFRGTFGFSSSLFFHDNAPVVGHDLEENFSWKL